MKKLFYLISIVGSLSRYSHAQMTPLPLEDLSPFTYREQNWIIAGTASSDYRKNMNLT